MSVKQMAKVWEWSKAEGARRLVMLALADHADDEGLCYPGVERIAKKCLISTRSVQRHMKDLQTMKELRVEIGKGCTVQGGTTNRYRLIVGEQARTLAHSQEPPFRGSGDNLSGGDSQGSEVVTNRAERGDTALSPKPSGEPSVKPLLSADAETCAIAFAEFWEAYPRHTDKAKAEAKFRQKRCFDKIEVLLAAIEKQKQTDQWQRGFVPHPTTWLHGERWEDNLDHEDAKIRTASSGARSASRPSRNEGTANSGRTEQYAGLGRVH